jgi:hypothetical protein
VASKWSNSASTALRAARRPAASIQTDSSPQARPVIAKRSSVCGQPSSSVTASVPRGAMETVPPEGKTGIDAGRPVAFQ